MIEFIVSKLHDARFMTMLLACVCWMTLGVLVMKKMINFDF